MLSSYPGRSCTKCFVGKICYLSCVISTYFLYRASCYVYLSIGCYTPQYASYNMCMWQLERSIHLSQPVNFPLHQSDQDLVATHVQTCYSDINMHRTWPWVHLRSLGMVRISFLTSTWSISMNVMHKSQWMWCTKVLSCMPCSIWPSWSGCTRGTGAVLIRIIMPCWCLCRRPSHPLGS